MCLIDTTECGDLSSGLRLRPFRETGDFAPLTKEDRCNVSINVYDEGKILQVGRSHLPKTDKDAFYESCDLLP